MLFDEISQLDVIMPLHSQHWSWAYLVVIDGSVGVPSTWVLSSQSMSIPQWRSGLLRHEPRLAVQGVDARQLTMLAGMVS